MSYCLKHKLVLAEVISLFDTRPGLSSTVKHIKGASDNEEVLLMRAEKLKKGNKNPA